MWFIDQKGRRQRSIRYVAYTLEEANKRNYKKIMIEDSDNFNSDLLGPHRRFVDAIV